AVAQDQSLLGELWLDPVIVRDAADAIARRLTTLRPPGEPDFHRNAAAVQSEIDRITKDFVPKLTAIAGRRVLVLSPAYNALLRRYQTVPVYVIHQPSPLRLTDSDIMRLRSAANDPAGRVATLLLEADTPPAVVNDLASRLGVQVLLLNSLGTSSDIGPTTYQDL